jgi:nucleoside-diphosphate-sugar epimerase
MKVLVTGGGGFIGGAVVRQLLERDDEVRSLTRSPQPELAGLGVDVRRGDLADPAAVRSAVDGLDAVVHVAARVGDWGPAAEFRRANVDGTRAVLDACRAAGVGRLVFTSTPSVVHAGGSISGGDESLPYAARYDSPYPATKAVAERMVLVADGPDLSTVALRPHLVWGPGDNYLLPGILQRARSGRLRFVGNGAAVLDTTWIDDAARAHLDALDRLAPGAACAGRAYFITGGDPRPQREMVNGILAAAGLPPATRSVPFPVALAAGAAVEAVWSLTRQRSAPPLTRFLARHLATDHWFDISAARRDLGYAPRVPVDEGLRRLAVALRR